MVHYYPTSHCRSSCNRHGAIGGTVYVITFENADFMDGEHHRECSHEDSWKLGREHWPEMFLSFDDEQLRIWFLRNICIQCVLSASLARWLVHSFLKISPWLLLLLMSNEKCCILNWIRNFIPKSNLNKVGPSSLPR